MFKDFRAPEMVRYVAWFEGVKLDKCYSRMDFVKNIISFVPGRLFWFVLIVYIARFIPDIIILDLDVTH